MDYILVVMVDTVNDGIRYAEFSVIVVLLRKTLSVLDVVLDNCRF